MANAVELVARIHQLELTLQKGSSCKEEERCAASGQIVEDIKQQGVPSTLALLGRVAFLLASNKASIRKCYIECAGWCIEKLSATSDSEELLLQLLVLNEKFLGDQAVSCRLKAVSNVASLAGYRFKSTCGVPSACINLLSQCLLDRSKLIRQKAMNVLLSFTVPPGSRRQGEKGTTGSKTSIPSATIDILVATMTINQNSGLFSLECAELAAEVLTGVDWSRSPGGLLDKMLKVKPEHPCRAIVSKVVKSTLKTYRNWEEALLEREDVSIFQNFLSQEAIKDPSFFHGYARLLGEATTHLHASRLSRDLRKCAVACRVLVSFSQVNVKGCQLSKFVETKDLIESLVALGPLASGDRRSPFFGSILLALSEVATSSEDKNDILKSFLGEQFLHIWEHYPQESLACLRGLKDPLLLVTQVLEAYESQYRCWSDSLTCSSARRFLKLLSSLPKVHAMVHEALLKQMAGATTDQSKKGSDYLAEEAERQQREAMSLEMSKMLLEPDTVLGRYVPFLSALTSALETPFCLKRSSLKGLGSYLLRSLDLALCKLELISKTLAAEHPLLQELALKLSARLILMSPNDFSSFTAQIVKHQTSGPQQQLAYKVYSFLVLQNRLKTTTLLQPLAVGLMDDEVRDFVAVVVRKLLADSGKSRHKTFLDLYKQCPAETQLALSDVLHHQVLTPQDQSSDELGSLLINQLAQGDKSSAFLLSYMVPSGKSLKRLEAALQVATKQKKLDMKESSGYLQQYLVNFKPHGASAAEKELQKNLISVLKSNADGAATPKTKSSMQHQVSKKYIHSLSRFKAEAPGRRLMDIVN